MSFMTLLLTMLRTLYGGLFADSTLVSSDGGEFSAHRAILARVPFFRAAFSHDFKEKKGHRIVLPECGAVVHILFEIHLRCPTKLDERSDPRKPVS